MIAAYNGGWRAGMMPPVAIVYSDGHKRLALPVCPYPAWRFVSYARWWSGYYDGVLQRLTQTF